MPCVAVIPARRAEGTIRMTLESLRLGNDAFVDRVFVVTSSDDPTAVIARAWSARDSRVELVSAPADRTAGAARNDGRKAAADWLQATFARDELLLLFIDADCRIEAGGAAALAAELRRDGAAARTSRVLGEGGLVARARHLLEFKEAASARTAPAHWLPPSTVMLCRAEAFDRVGGFPDLWPGEDLVFSQALRDHGETVERSDRVLAVHRHPHGFFEMLRHQHRLGRTAAIARTMRPMRGSLFAAHRTLALALLPARAVRIALWQLGEGRIAGRRTAFVWPAPQAALVWPLVVAGLVAWTAGFAGHAGRPGREERAGHPAGARAGLSSRTTWRVWRRVPA